MMVDEYDTQSTFAYFFKISRKGNLIFIHLKLIFRKNVIDENRFKILFYNKKKMSQKNLWWSISMTHPSVHCVALSERFTSAVRETGAFRHNGGPIQGTPW